MTMLDVTAGKQESRQLRDYQQAAIDQLRDSLRSGKRRPMLQAPTGAGKTLVASTLVNMAVAKGNPVCFVVPALNLIDQTVEAGTPVALFTTRMLGGAVQSTNRQQYAVSPDGQRFLVNTLAEEATTSPITLILNWKPGISGTGR